MIRRVVAGLVVLVVAAIAFGAYATAADRTFDQATKAHRAGDCDGAAAKYRRVTGFFKLASDEHLSEARRGAAECRRTVAAEQLATDGAHLAAADAFAEVRRDFPDSPIRDRHERREAEVLLTLAEKRQASAESGSDYVRAVEPLERTIGELGSRPEAKKARAAVAATWARASKASDPCRRSGRLDAFAAAPFAVPETRQLGVRARRALPNALFQCGQRQFASGAYDEAAEAFRRIGDDFSRAPLARRAAVRLIDAEVAGVRAGGAAGRLPPPTQRGSSAGRGVALSIQNDSPEALEVLLSGARSLRLNVPACRGCVAFGVNPGTCRASGSPTRRLTLPAGSYEVVVRGTSERRVNPFSGRWRLSPGTAYSNCFFIVSR